MNPRSYLRNNQSFTLVELLVVIGILAILTAAVLLVINPVEYLKQSRDTTRMSDLSSINQALSVLESQGATNFGNINTVYVSLPNASSDCSGLGLPTLPSGWVYHCAPSTTLQNVNGTGWIPVDFTQSSTLAFSNLPIDPINSTSTGNYYTYVTGGSWELDTIFESSKYRNNTQITKANLPGVYAKGTNLTLSPLYNTSGLVGYWPFDEGSGTIAYDKSGNGNNGTLTNGPTWKSGKVGGALSFDGVNDAVNTSGNFPSIAGNFTISIWTKWNQFQNYGGIVFNYAGNTAPYFNFFLSSYTSSIGFYLSNGVTIQSVSQSYASVNIVTNNWYLLNVVADGSFIRFYFNGILKQSVPQTVSSVGSSFPFSISHSIDPFNGSLDEVRIYNRALSASEIQALYNATK